jgi:hypothetical protein
MSTIKNDFDIRTVDKDMLVDADDVRVDIDAPKKERMASTVEQMNGNPYFFKCKNAKGDGYLAVEVAYGNTDLLVDDCAESWLRVI